MASKMVTRITLTLLVVVVLFAQPLVGLVREPRQTFEADQDAKSSTNGSIDDYRVFSEPYNTLVQTSAKIVFIQSVPAIPDLIGVDATMEAFNKAAHALSKPAVLAKVLVPVVAMFVALTVGALFAPNAAAQFLQAVWHRPDDLLRIDKWLPFKDTLDMLNMKSDQFTARIGLTNQTCRERTVCKMGELIHCKFPSSSEALIKFLKRHQIIRNSKSVYMRSFAAGLVDRNCANENEIQPPDSCFSTLIEPWINSDATCQKAPSGGGCKS